MKVEFWCHRGSQTDNEASRAYDRPGHPAENTIAGIRRALEGGADGIEIDVMRTGDADSSGLKSGQRLVVTHTNESAQHVFGADGKPESHGFISDMTLAQVKELRVGPGRDGIIPTLTEVLEAVANYSMATGRKPTLNIEIKDAKDTRFPDLAKSDVIELLLEALETSPLPTQQIVMSSFRLEDLQRVESTGMGIRLGMLFFGKPSEPKPIYPASPKTAEYIPFTIENVDRVLAAVPSLTSVNPEMNDIGLNPGILKHVAGKDLALHPWFLREPRPEEHWAQVYKTMQLAAAAGIEKMIIISNFAGELKSFFHQQSKPAFQTSSPGNCPV